MDLTPTGTSFLPLPPELTLEVLGLLKRDSLKAVCRVNSEAYELAVGLLWKDVSLIDCRSLSNESHGDPGNEWAEWAGRDEHDDSPLIHKLFILARNPHVASKVQTLTHRCHLPLPAMFSELPMLSPVGPSLSNDWRTIRLARLAVRNMTNVQTLRLINGHFNLTQVLLNEFIDRKSNTECKLRHLWLECCSLQAVPGLDALQRVLPSLESVRFRRMRMIESKYQYVYSRGGGYSIRTDLHNGKGGVYETCLDFKPKDSGLEDDITELSPIALRKTLNISNEHFNQRMYEEELINAAESRDISDLGLPPILYYLTKTWTEDCKKAVPLRKDIEGSRNPDESCGIYRILKLGSSSLKYLTLDWILTMNPSDHNGEVITEQDVQYSFFQKLSSLTFPHLRALQLRNAVTTGTRLVPRIYLLHPQRVDDRSIDMLSFMERHPNLTCLAWPIDRFFSHGTVPEKIHCRALTIAASLGRSLVSLRVDSFYTSVGEMQTDKDMSTFATEARLRRRRFVMDFATHMSNLTSLKMEGGIPRDEKRETIRAIHRCPLRKLVLIGVSCPIGNNWGANGQDLRAVDGGHFQPGILEAEAADAIIGSTHSNAPVPSNAAFAAKFDWPPSPPMLHTIALHHAATITELKLCGYGGSPVLHKPMAITSALLHHLRHFHNLKDLILSLWLLTYFELEHREEEIIQYWLDQRDATSTALVATNPAEANPWEIALKKLYSPSALAHAIFDLVGPHISPQARARQHQDGTRGLNVRGSFCLGVESSDIFDLDVPIDDREGGIVPDAWTGPREEIQPDRWWGKLNARQWF